MKVGLSNHQYVCLSRSDNFETLAIQGDPNAIIFNPIASVISKLLRFKVVR
jgi:hypothetical protein